MTNDTTPHESSAVDQAIAAAITTAEQISETVSEALTALAPEPAEPAEPKAPTFEDLGLHPDILQALADMGYFKPTPVQTAVYKPVSEGKDLLVQSRTGTGKTTAFGLPLINNLIPTHRQPQALILCPTRELALQVARELTQIGKHRGVLVETLYGGAPIGKQITNLKNGVHVVVGTPGRVLDHIGRRTLNCSTINQFVLDECDEMLSMGFLEDIERVVSNLPEKKQTMLFSATMPDEVSRYARRHMKAPEQISLSRDSISVTDIHHAYYIVSGIARSRDLLKIIYAEEPESAIIFCNMRDETTMVSKFLQKQGLDAEPLSSDLSQADRERVMGRMKAKNLRFLCATDVAARGIDISNLSHVINYSVPEQPEIYVHRTGRTGRAGKKGTALSMVGPRELGNFRYVRLTFGIKPEERLLPKDSIFEGKLKVPLPPVGVPQPPDPVQILIRGVSGTPTDLERQIFEKLLGTANGKRVLAKLVADKLDKLSTRSRKRPERDHASEGEQRAEGGAGGDREERPRFRDRDERPRSRDRDPDRTERFERGDRDRGGERGASGGDRGPGGPGGDRGPGGPGGPGGGERGDRERRPWRDRDDKFESRGGGGERGERGGGERGGGERGGGERGDRERRPWRDRGEPQRDAAAPAVTEASDTQQVPITSESERHVDGGRDRDRDHGRDRGDRGDRGGRDRDRGGRDRDRGGERRFDRDRNRDDRNRDDRNRDDRNRGPRTEETAIAATDAPVDAPVVIESAPAEVEAIGADSSARRDEGSRDSARRDERPAREDRPGREDRNNRRDRERRDTTFDAAPPAIEVGTEAAPAVETESAHKVEDVARAAIERADRGDRGGKRDKKSAPTAETREFWETWAEEKSTRPTPEPAAAATEESEERPAAAPAREERGGRGRGGRDKERGGRDKERGRSRDRSEKPAAASKEDASSSEKPSRTKRDTEQTPAAAAAAGDQARLFISLGKKHGVSADDLRELLAGPIGGDKARIGSVSLRDSHAHVRVPEDLVDQIIAGVHGTKHDDHDVTVERSRA